MSDKYPHHVTGIIDIKGLTIKDIESIKNAFKGTFLEKTTLCIKPYNPDITKLICDHHGGDADVRWYSFQSDMHKALTIIAEHGGVFATGSITRYGKDIDDCIQFSARNGNVYVRIARMIYDTIDCIESSHND